MLKRRVNPIQGGNATNKTNSYISRNDALELEYPYRYLFTTENAADRAFEVIKSKLLKFVKTKYTIANMPELAEKDLDFNGAGPTLIEMDLSDYYTMNWLSDFFNEKCRLSGRRYDEPLSPLDYWRAHKQEIVDSLCPAHEMRSKTLTLEKLNDAVYSKVRGCNNFRPMLMSGFIKHFGAKSVLDFSAGWGDRLIGAIAAGYVEKSIYDDDYESARFTISHIRYVGVDPNPCVHEGYKKIIERWGDSSKHTVIKAPFQTAQLPDEKFDLVLTSPPYYDLEIYSDDADQSTSEFKSLDSWFDGFLITSLKKCWAHLNVNGHMIVVINNVRGGPDYVMRMIRAVSEFSGAEYLGVVSYADKIEAKHGRNAFYKSPQPMWIWRKSRAD